VIFFQSQIKTPSNCPTYDFHDFRLKLSEISLSILGQHYHMGEMDKAESVCADRCTSKFMEMHELIGKEITEFSMKNQAKMEAAKN